MDRLLQEALPWAQQFLTKYGEFVPFAVAMSETGEPQMVAAYDGSAHGTTADLLKLLYEGLHGKAGEIRAAAVAVDIRLKELQSDAIRVEIEHREGVAIGVVLPYRVKKKLLGRELSYGEMVAVDTERRIWLAAI
jgi:hypothetical protein